MALGGPKVVVSLRKINSVKIHESFSFSLILSSLKKYFLLSLDPTLATMTSLSGLPSGVIEIKHFFSKKWQEMLPDQFHS
jgi:hypothetical protein